MNAIAAFGTNPNPAIGGCHGDASSLFLTNGHSGKAFMRFTFSS